MRTLLSLVVVIAACGTDVEPGCEPNSVDYQTFGAAFMANWCTGCHSADTNMRQSAPTNVDFDTLDEIRVQAFAITRTTAVARTMPPAGGPSDAEREMLAAWLTCGAP